MRCKGAWGGATVVRKCDSHQGGVKGIRKVFQLMEMCDGHVGGVKECDTCQYVEGLFESYWGSINLRNFYLYFVLQVSTRKSNKS